MTEPSPAYNLDARLELHREYWDRRPQQHPVAAFRVAPDFFFSRHFKAAAHLLVPGKEIQPDMLVVDDFLADYEEMFQTSVQLGQDAFWTAEPFTGIPWMEAIMGCKVIGETASFVSKPWMDSLDQLDQVRLDMENPWLQKYLEFTEKLATLSDGRFPVGMPIMRGPSDSVGAIMGQTEMVMAMADEPELMQQFFRKIAQYYVEVIRMQKALSPEFHSGQSMGFYHVFCPGSCTWYQEDLSALMSPTLYHEFLVEPEAIICQGYQHTAIHLHPASFFILDELMKNDWLTAIEVNKDVGGPSVAEMIPHLAKVAEQKNLILWGDFTIEELDILRDGLPSRGLFLHVIAPDMATAEQLRDHIWAWNK